MFARFKKMWRDAERNIHRKRVEAAAQKRMADQYNRTVANPNLSPQEREAIECWRRERLLAEIEYEKEVLRKPLF